MVEEEAARVGGRKEGGERAAYQVREGGLMTKATVQQCVTNQVGSYQCISALSPSFPSTHPHDTCLPLAIARSSHPLIRHNPLSPLAPYLHTLMHLHEALCKPLQSLC